MSDTAHPPIVLLTDFGLQDGYVGVMKGVIAGIAPGVPVIDLSHEVPAQDIPSAAFLLETSWSYFPERSLFLAVVDPGVGSSRRGLGVRSHARFFIGPDNGILSVALDVDSEIRSIENAKLWLAEVSKTFHGRDIFAPVAAALASGTPFEQIGPLISDPIRREAPPPTHTSAGLVGQIVYVDRFGNLVTNFPPELLRDGETWAALTPDGAEWPFLGTYADTAPGERCAVVGGFRRIELSINRGSAAQVSGLGIGSAVLLRATSQ